MGSFCNHHIDFSLDLLPQDAGWDQHPCTWKATNKCSKGSYYLIMAAGAVLGSVLKNRIGVTLASRDQPALGSFTHMLSLEFCAQTQTQCAPVP